MYLTELPGLRIISLISALRMGTVESALIDPSCRFVAALRVREYGPGGRRLIPREMVKRVGRHAVIVARDMGADEESLDHVERLVPLDGLIGLEVVSDRGDLLGYVRDLEMDRDTLTFERIEIVRSQMDRVLRLRPPLRVDAQLVICGSRDAMLLPEAAFAPAYDEALRAAQSPEETQPTRPARRLAPSASANAHPDTMRWSPPDLPHANGDMDHQETAMG